MTENEAKEIIKRKSSIPMENETFEYVSEAYDMAIGALEKVQQYEAIGTVEGYKRAVEMSKENYLLYAEYKKKVESFESIGTIERFRELTEKAEPKKPSEIDEREEESFYYLAFICPTCKNAVTGQPYRPNYCKHCGQRLNWE